MRNDMLICRCLEFFALQKIGITFKLLSYSCLTRVSMDPRNKSEDDCSKCMSEDDCYKKMSPNMTVMMWILVSSLTMTNMAHAECTPVPNCASIGYILTSCFMNII